MQATAKAKPFLKWAGGKTQLLSTIDARLPLFISKEKAVTYIEPFVGGGAMLFHMLQNYPTITKAVINDINPRLINTYKVVREEPHSLIEFLSYLQAEYRAIGDWEGRKAFYLEIREKFNTGHLSCIEEAGLMIFMNRTCFNGLYRENSKGAFNVPFGRCDNPTICDANLILADSELLKRVEILNSDFSKTKAYAEGYTLFYFDPPYRPLNATSGFNTYVKEPFDDSEQLRLRDFFVEMSDAGCMELLSNSDGRGRNAGDCFFDELYRDFVIERVSAKRCINANPLKRGALTELLIRNYKDCKGI